MQGRESSVSQALVATKIHSCIMWEGLPQGDCDRGILSRLERQPRTSKTSVSN